jgi:hypothetical protein
MMGGLERIDLAQDRDHKLPVVKTAIFWLYITQGTS